jgi:hypothetical protein
MEEENDTVQFPLEQKISNSTTEKVLYNEIS